MTRKVVVTAGAGGIGNRPNVGTIGHVDNDSLSLSERVSATIAGHGDFVIESTEQPPTIEPHIERIQQHAWYRKFEKRGGKK